MIENVGNLVCPAEFKVGEDARVMVSSVTEGEDKPLKYPLMFRTCELVLINKIDLLEHLDFDLDLFLYNLDAVNPGVERCCSAPGPARGPTPSRDWLARGRERRRRPRPEAIAARPRSEPRDRRQPTLRAERERGATAAFFEAEADALARLCHRMAERFARGGRLVAVGRLARRALRRPPRHRRVRPPGDRRQAGAAGDRPDRARAARSTRQVDLIAEPDDIVIAFGAARGRAARRCAPALADRARARLPDDRLRARAPAPSGSSAPPSDDPCIRQELAETAYHVLWELVHVFFEHRGLLEGREAGPVHDTGASSFLYPFLSEARDRPRRGARRRPRLGR